MKKTSKTSKKGKAPRRGEAPVTASVKGFTPIALDGMASSSKQYNAEGFKK